MKHIGENDELKERSPQEPEAPNKDDREGTQQIQKEQPAHCPKEAKLLAALSACSRKMLDDVKKSMMRFGHRTPQQKAQDRTVSEGFAEKGEMQRLQAGIRSAVVDHDAKTVAEGGKPPIPGATIGDEGLKSAKGRRVMKGRKGRSR